MHMFVCFCESRRYFSLLLSLKYIISFFLPAPSVPVCSCLLCVPWLPCVPVACPVLSSVCAPWLPCRLPSLLFSFIPIGRAPEALRRPSVCPAVCRLAPAVTRQPSGARCCGNVDRCSAYISPAFFPLARHVLPCVPLPVPWLVLWLPAVCPCVCAAVCRLVAVTAYTPLYPGRRLFGAASAM